MWRSGGHITLLNHASHATGYYTLFILVSDAIHFTWATLSTDISLSTGATLGNTHYSA